MNNWISVKERLPEEKRYVLVYAKPYMPSHKNMRVGISARSPARTGEPNNFTGQREVTHWMELPDPPATNNNQ